MIDIPSQNTRHRLRLGVLVPFTNTNLEPDMARLAPPGAAVYAARLGGYDQDEIPDEHQMADLGASDMDEPLRLILGVRPHVVFYGCTSATLTHGPAFDRDLAARIHATAGVPTITAAGALVHALTSLKITRVAFASPYVGKINDMAEAFLAEQGITTVSRADIGVALDNYGQGALTPDQICALAARAVSPDAQAIVLSCTDMRSVECIARLEDALGKPVVCSNQAMIYQAMGLLGLEPWPALAAHGRLFATPP
ncbi:MAG: aspartate/glutamate racemase family protein [Pseudomonadota bacterium]